MDDPNLSNLERTDLPADEPVQRPGCVTAYAILIGIGGVLAIMALAAFALLSLAGQASPGMSRLSVYEMVIMGVILVPVAAQVIVAWGLWNLRNWARNVVLILLGFGFVTGGLSLCYSLYVLSQMNNPFIRYSNPVPSIIAGIIGLGINAVIFRWFYNNKQYFA